MLIIMVKITVFVLRRKQDVIAMLDLPSVADAQGRSEDGPQSEEVGLR